MNEKLTDTIKLVSKHFDLVVKGRKINYINGEFDAYEMIAKGNAMLDVISRTTLNRIQKKQILKIIKEL